MTSEQLLGLLILSVLAIGFMIAGAKALDSWLVIIAIVFFALVITGIIVFATGLLTGEIIF